MADSDGEAVITANLDVTVDIEDEAIRDTVDWVSDPHIRANDTGRV